MDKPYELMMNIRETLPAGIDRNLTDENLLLIIKGSEPYYREIAKEAVKNTAEGFNDGGGIIYSMAINEAVKAIDDAMGGE
mgnify:CR=1 FL=1